MCGGIHIQLELAVYARGEAIMFAYIVQIMLLIFNY